MIRAIAALILLLVATPALALEDADYSAAVAATAKNAIIPGYQAFGASAKEMQARLDALCKAPGDETLKAAQRQFAATATAWALVSQRRTAPTCCMMAAPARCWRRSCGTAAKPLARSSALRSCRPKTARR